MMSMMSEADIRKLLPVLEFFNMPQVSNREVWVFAATIEGTSPDDIRDRLAQRTFKFEVIDDDGDKLGATLLEASNANGKFFVVPTAGVIGWAFSEAEMATLKPGRTYQTRMQVSDNKKFKRVDISPLVVRGA
jgi:hypothetical protein